MSDDREVGVDRAPEGPTVGTGGHAGTMKPLCRRLPQDAVHQRAPGALTGPGFYSHFYSATRYGRSRAGTSGHDDRAESQLSGTIGDGQGRAVTGFDALITRRS